MPTLRRPQGLRPPLRPPSGVGWRPDQRLSAAGSRRDAGAEVAGADFPSRTGGGRVSLRANVQPFPRALDTHAAPRPDCEGWPLMMTG
jgi:hypothetical protein